MEEQSVMGEEFSGNIDRDRERKIIDLHDERKNRTEVRFLRNTCCGSVATGD